MECLRVRAVLCGLFCVGLWLGAPSAQAFRCTQASGDSLAPDGPSLSWRHRALTFTLQPLGSKNLPLDATLKVLRQAFAVWQNQVLTADDQASCGTTLAQSDITFTEVPGSKEADWVGFNFLAPQTNTNLLVFRDTFWPPPDPDATDIIALSTITYSALSGEIIDADIEFNSANFGFSATDPNGEQMDLLSTAVHEIGHFLGLAHCANKGSCGNNEVMEATANLGEYDKRELRCDDLEGLVFKYPKGASNGYASKLASLNNPHQGLGTCLPPQEAPQIPSVRQRNRAQGRSGCQQVHLGAQEAGLAAVTGLMMRALRRRRVMRDKLGIGLLLAMWAGLSGCGASNACGGTDAPINARAPLILSMDLVGQVDIDPWHVVLSCDVTDGDGDMGGGEVNYFVNGAPTSEESQSLERVFNASGGVRNDSTDAKLQLLVRFSRASANNAYLHLGTQITDKAGHKSNCYELDLSYLLATAPL